MKKKISIKDVAKFANVSPGTVSNYMNKTTPVNEVTGRNIKNAISKLNYKRNVIASSLRRAKTTTIGVILPDIKNPFYSEFFYYFENSALKKGYNTVLGNFDYDKKRLVKYFELFQSRRVDVIVLSANYSINVNKIIEHSDVPVIVIEPSKHDQIVSTIGVNNVKGAYDAVKFLISKGHKKIAIITSSTNSRRYEGYRKAMLEAEIDEDKHIIKTLGKFSSNLFEQGFDAMNDLLDSGNEFTACFIIADMLALGAIDALKKANKKIPDDVAIASFDNIPVSELIEPKLTTVSQPVNKMAVETLNLCLDVINDDEQIVNKVLMPKLVIRDTV